MIVRKFIRWSQGAPASARAEGVGALAHSYLYDDMGVQERHETEQVLFALLDDPSPLVRRAMAESFASALDAPPAIVYGLACDQSTISAVVLSRSPLLTDAQLIDCAAIGDTNAQAAIALRCNLSPAVSAALAEIASREALIVLAVNEGAHLPDFAMRRMIERFADDGELREALLGRAWLPGVVRARLADATARQLADYAVSRNWMSRARSERVAKDSRDRATMIIAASCAEYSEETGALASYLRIIGQLTPGLALRALLCGQTGLFQATLVELTGLSPRRVAGLTKQPHANGFAALYAKAGLPAPLLPAFCAALATLGALAAVDPFEEEEGALRLPVIEAVLRCCVGSADPGLDRLVALLRRFESEAAREDGRRGITRMLVDKTPPSAMLTRSDMQTSVSPAPLFVTAPPLAKSEPIKTPVEPLAATVAAAPMTSVAVASPSVAEPLPPTVEPWSPAAAPNQSLEIAIDLDALERELLAA